MPEQPETGETRHAIPFSPSRHARSRMHSRSINRDAVEAVLTYGRRVFARGAVIYAIGKKEVRRFAAENIDLRPFSGCQVVCSHDDQILTVYRNHDFSSLTRSRA